MRLTKNVLMSIGAAALAIVLVNVIAPQAAHAAVAALVQVSNTATNPALTSRIDDPGRIPYQAQKFCNPCQDLTYGPVPANHRLVVEHISGQVDFKANPSESSLQVIIPQVRTSVFFTPTNPKINSSLFDQPVHFYVEQNQSMSVQVAGDQAINAVQITLTGYLLDCNAAPCGAIASF
jgi:hypothetical protein